MVEGISTAKIVRFCKSTTKVQKNRIIALPVNILTGVAHRLLGPHDTLPCVLIYSTSNPFSLQLLYSVRYIFCRCLSCLSCQFFGPCYPWIPGYHISHNKGSDLNQKYSHVISFTCCILALHQQLRFLQ